MAPSPQAMGATSGLVTQLTLLGVLFGPPAAFAALSTDSSSGMMVNIIAALAVCFSTVALALRGRRQAPMAVGAHGTPTSTH